MLIGASIENTLRLMRDQVRARRVNQGFSQKELAARAGVGFHSLQRFEQTGQISLESFFKIQMALGTLEEIYVSIKVEPELPKSIDDIIDDRPKKRGKIRVRRWKS